MAAFIFDASGIVKRYLTEIGSGWVQGLTDPAAAHEIFLTRLTRVEIVAAVTRRCRGGPVPAAARRRSSPNSAMMPPTSTPSWKSRPPCWPTPNGWRKSTACGPTTPCNWRRRPICTASGLPGLSRPTLISADQDLNAAAMAEGIDVDDPPTHP